MDAGEERNGDRERSRSVANFDTRAGKEPIALLEIAKSQLSGAWIATFGTPDIGDYEFVLDLLDSNLQGLLLGEVVVFDRIFNQQLQ